jgi:hypothetical protein
MSDLAAGHRTVFLERGIRGQPVRRWVAADMTMTTDGDFLTGTLGFSERETRITFDEESFSWAKGAVDSDETGSPKTVVPFAVDLRNQGRWIAFAVTQRLRPETVIDGLKKVLNQAVVDAKMVPTEWDVDLIMSRGTVMEWIRRNPRIREMRRTIRFSNPGRDIDEDRLQMRELGAKTKRETFTAESGLFLNTGADLFAEKLVGTETGDLDLHLEARGAGQTKFIFNSKEHADHSYVRDYGSDLRFGMELVLAALLDYIRADERS